MGIGRNQYIDLMNQYRSKVGSVSAPCEAGDVLSAVCMCVLVLVLYV